VVRKSIRKRPAYFAVALAMGLFAGLASPAVAEPVHAEPDTSASATAKRTGERVEVTALRTATRKVYANPSGMMTLVQQVGPQERWTQVNQASPNRSYWDSGRAEGARVGLSLQPPGVFRSFFQMDTSLLAGSTVRGAGFRINVDDSNSCEPSPVDLWHTKPIDPAVPLTWNNSKDNWLGGGPLASGSGQACGEFDMGIEFGTPALQNLVQRTADERTGVLALGLRAPREYDPRQEKLFHPESVYLSVDYNTPPNMPRVNFSNPKPCGTADAPVLITRGSKTFAGSATDPDGDNISTTLEILRADGSLLHSTATGWITSGSAFSWPDLPGETFTHGATYHYRARTEDAKDTGPYTPDCYFTVDAVGPGVPRISSTDYPNGVPAILERTTGTVTLRPAAGDTDIAAYRYGFDNIRMGQTIKAGPDGSAVLPLTLFPNPLTNESSEWFYVEAVDKAGNISDVTPTRDLYALPNPAPQAHVAGDLTGDGRADVTALLDYGGGRTTTWNVVARDGGFHAATTVFDTDGDTGVPQDRFRQVRGDFDGDGRTDIAMLTQLRSGRLDLWELGSDGVAYAARQVWSSGSELLPISAARTLSGDFTQDGKTDIALQLGTPGGWRVLVFPGGALGSPTTWFQSADADFAHARLTAGDFDGDGTAELAELRDQGNCQTSVRTHRSTGTAFETGVLKWQGAYCADRGTPVTGDVDGDGRDDIVALYDHGDSDTAMMAFTAASGFVPREWWRRTGEFDAGKAVISTGDFDLDGKADLAVVYAADQTQLWTLRSTGAAFADRVLGWQEVTGGKPVQSGR
jgi:hypothetical protein